MLEGFRNELPSLVSYFSLRSLWCHDLSQYQHPPTKHALLIILLQNKPSKILWYCIVVSRLADYWQSLHQECFCHCFLLLSTITSTQSFQRIWNQCKYFGNKFASQNETHPHNLLDRIVRTSGSFMLREWSVQAFFFCFFVFGWLG